MMHRFPAVIVLTLGLGGVALLWGCGDDETDAGVASATQTGTPSDVQIPDFTSEDEANVRQIIAADAGVADVRGASSLEIESVGLWHVGST